MATSRLNVDFTVVIAFNSTSYPQFERFGPGVDVSQLVYSLDFTESIGDGSCGNISVALLPDRDDVIQNILSIAAYRIGSTITCRVNGVQLFVGYVTSVSKEQDGTYVMYARDILFYLGNKTSYLIEEQNNIEGVFNAICSLAGLKEKQYRFDGTIPPNSRIPFKHFSGETFFDILKYCSEFHLLQTRQWYEPIIENGVIVFRDILGQTPRFIFGDGLFTGEYTREENTDNMVNSCTILLARTKKNPTVINENYGGTPVLSQDTASINKYGTFKHYEVATDITQAQAQEYADSIVNAYKEPNVTFQISSQTGSSLVRAGRSVFVAFTQDGVFGRYIVQSVRHSFSGQVHSMDVVLYDSAYRSAIWDELYTRIT